MKITVRAKSDYERELASQHTEDVNFGDPGYAEAQDDEYDAYLRDKEKYGWSDGDEIEASEDTDKAQYVFGIIDDKSGDILGYLSGYRKGGFYHPGSVVQGKYEISSDTRSYDDEAKAERALRQYQNYSEVYMYDPSSRDYPMPSEKWLRKEVPTHLEVVRVDPEVEEVEASDNIKSWKDDPYADLYVVKIWHEVEPSNDTAGPVAAEEVFQIVANSPDQAKERAKMQWSGPIDRIEVVDVNPEIDVEELPFDYPENDYPIESGTEVTTYRNKKNGNKYMEVHRDGYGHQSAKQYMHWDETDVTNPTGDGNLHRHRKDNLNDILEDYEEVESATEVTKLDDEVDEMLADKYNVVYIMDNDIEGLGGRGGSVVLLKADDSEPMQNVYRIFIDTKYNELIFQVLRDAWLDGDEEYYDYAVDFNDCSIEGMSALDVFKTIEQWISDAEQNCPNFTEWEVVPDDPSGEGITGSTSVNSKVAEWYTADSYPEIDPSRINAVHNIDWDINAEDVEIFLTEESTFPDLTRIAQVSYFDDNQKKWAEENGYEWGYNVVYEDGTEKQFAWLPYPHNLEPLTDVTGDVPENIAGSTNIEADSTIQTSGCSFDFDLGHSYNSETIERKISDAFEDMDMTITGMDFHSVDYPKDKTYSQCSFDFEWRDYYNEAEIEEAIANIIEDEGGNYLGMEFYAL